MAIDATWLTLSGWRYEDLPHVAQLHQFFQEGANALVVQSLSRNNKTDYLPMILANVHKAKTIQPNLNIIIFL